MACLIKTGFQDLLMKISSFSEGFVLGLFLFFLDEDPGLCGICFVLHFSSAQSVF